MMDELTNYFFDIHCHVFNLSHPNLLLFVRRQLAGARLKLIAVVFILLWLVLSLGTRLSLFVDNPVAGAVSIGATVLLSAGLLILLLIVCFSPFTRILLIFRPIRRIFNLLSVMENNAGEYLALMERDLARLFRDEPDAAKNLRIRKIVITPLIMDFGYKWVNSFPGIHYHRLSKKPVAEQVVDLLNGIKAYAGRTRRGTTAAAPKRLMEVYPFLGLNPQNYPLGNESKVRLKRSLDLPRLKRALGPALAGRIDFVKTGPREKYLRFQGRLTEEAKGIILGFIRKKADRDQIECLRDESLKKDRTTVGRLLAKYFGKVGRQKPAERHRALLRKMGEFTGDLEDQKADFNYFFAGVKVYPPLGFDPWPRDETEREKVKLLYRTCLDKNIPITTHCGGLGYQAVGNRELKAFLLPRWEEVLAEPEFRGLKMNFAHFGDLRGARAKAIFRLIMAHDNVYTDFSCQCLKERDYRRLARLIGRLTKGEAAHREKLLSRVCFGSDFMINLLMTDSYRAYYEAFFRTAAFSDEEKRRFGRDNPARFLFGEPATPPAAARSGAISPKRKP